MLDLLCVNRSGKEDVPALLGDVLAIRVIVESAAAAKGLTEEVLRGRVRQLVEAFRSYIRELDIFGELGLVVPNRLIKQEN